MNKNYEFLIKNDNDRKNKVLFLDISGVIKKPFGQTRFDHDMTATCKMLKKKYRDDNFIKMKNYDVCAAYYDFEEIQIGMLAKLLRATDTNIVISSYWKDLGLDNIKSLFKLYNLEDYVIDVCNDGDKALAIKNYLESHPQIDKYMVVSDSNMYKEFTDNFRLTRELMSYEDFEYLYTLLKFDLKVTDTGKQLFVDNDLILDYHYEEVDNSNVMYLSVNYKSRYPSKVHVEYLLAYILNKDADMFVFDSSNLPFDNIKVNGYEAGKNLYFIYKDVYMNYVLKNTKKLILSK